MSWRGGCIAEGIHRAACRIAGGIAEGIELLEGFELLEGIVAHSPRGPVNQVKPAALRLRIELLEGFELLELIEGALQRAFTARAGQPGTGD